MAGLIAFGALAASCSQAQVLNPSFEADQANVVWQACPSAVPAACAVGGAPCVQQRGLPVVLGCGMGVGMEPDQGRFAHMEICDRVSQRLFQAVDGIESCEGFVRSC